MSTAVPRHLAVIMDGNRRWAKDKGLNPWEGHRAGYDRLKQVGDWCLEKGVEVLSVFAFSTENWKRTQEEVGFLMDFMERMLGEELSTFHNKGVRLKIIGRREELRPSLRRAIEHAEQVTGDNTKGILCLCLNYGGRTEIVDACRSLMRQGISADDIDEQKLQSALYWPDMPEPDLIIRTSGEERLSGFLMWQSAYSELYWSQKHWPDFDEQDLDAALECYASRQRRFGK